MKPLTLYTQLHTNIQTWIELSEAEWQALATVFCVCTSEAGKYLALPDTAQHEVLFVCSGLLRFYYIDEAGSESNKAFIVENQFAAPLAAYNLELPLFYGIQALEPTTYLAAACTDMDTLYENYPRLERFGRKLAESLLIGKELRTRSLLQQGATERYLEFMRAYPHLIERVPQYHIASYLGITDVSLSRLKRELNKC